jgi:GNAT superfamily N-acetyltransferase
MIDGKFDVPGVGECLLEGVPLTSEANKSYVFELSHSGTDVGYFSVGPVYDDDTGEATDGVEIVTLAVEELFRGIGVGSFLVNQAVKFARKKGASSVITFAANERTVRAFSRNFDGGRQLALKATDAHGVVQEGEISETDAVEFLRAQRKRQFPDDIDSSELLKEGPAVYMAGQLA